MLKIETAVLSVSDKSGLAEFAKFLAGYKVKLVSTGGTARALSDAGLDVVPITAITGNSKDDYFDGRMKTISFNFESALLYDRDNPQHVKQAVELGIPKIDMVVCNLYPFEKTVAQEGVTVDDAVHNIDVGGPCMIRAAAKNYRHVAIVVSPDLYPEIMNTMKKNNGCLPPEMCEKLCAVAFERTADYDAAIHTFFANAHNKENVKRFKFVQGTQLGRYAENWHQKGWIYLDDSYRGPNVPHAKQVYGGPLGYNNYMDASAALASVLELRDSIAVSIIKHLNPCGYATGETLQQAFERAWEGDPVSAFGSVIAVTRPFDLETAHLIQDRFVEVILAPHFNVDALDFIKKLGTKKEGLRLLEYGDPHAAHLNDFTWRYIPGGVLQQEADNLYYLGGDASALFQKAVERDCPNSGKKLLVGMVSARTANPSRKGLCEFALRHIKHLKSNAINVAREYAGGYYQILGMGCGQPNRRDSVEIAGQRATENLKAEFFNSYEFPPQYRGAATREAYLSWLNENSHKAQHDDYIKSEQAYLNTHFSQDNIVLASDAFFPFRDGLDNVAKIGIKFVLEPGGSVKDKQVITAANEHEIALIFTGVRKFNH